MKIPTLVTLGLVAASLAVEAAGSKSAPPSGRTLSQLTDSTIKNSVIVEFKSSPSILGGSPQTMEEERKEFLAALDAKGIKYEVRTVFGSVINGISLNFKNSADISAVANLTASVDNVSQNFIITKSGQGSAVVVDKATAIPQLKFAHNRTAVNQVHTNLNITGKGVKVGIIDSGIDYTHPAFGACQKIGEGCRVAYGYDFVGDDYDPSSDDPEKWIPKPGDDPRDCDGHGTHVAGIVGGKDGEFVGVAPEVTFGAYRVFGCASYGLDNDLVLAALERAFKDGMNIINLSLGTSSIPWGQSVIGKAVNRLASNLVVVVSALGNDGADGLWSAGDTGSATYGLGVAASENDFYLEYTFRASPDNKETEYDMDPKDRELLKDGELMVSNTDMEVKDDGCAPYPSSTFTGKIALIRRGTCPFTNKALHAQAAGAIAVIIYNNRPEALRGILAVHEDLHIPVAGISGKDGEELVRRSKTAPVTVQWSKTRSTFPNNPLAGQVADFSSWGMTAELDIKPEVTAPGALVFSSIPLSMGGYATWSGTSMATPYVSGVAALYLNRDGKTVRRVAPGKMKQILMNNAVPINLLDGGMSAPVARQGAGLVNAFQAVQGSTLVWPFALKLGDDRVGQTTIARTLYVRNAGNIQMKYSLSHLPAASVNGTVSEEPTLDTRYSAVVITPSTLELAPFAMATVKITISPNATMPAQERWLYSGYIKVDPVAPPATQSSRYNPVFVPYAGLKGDYTGYPVLPTGEAAPFLVSEGQWLAADDPTTYRSPNETATFTFREETQDFPVIRTHILHPSPLITITLHKIQNGQQMGFVAYDRYIPKRVGRSSIYFTWRAPGEVKAAVLKDPVNKPNEWTPVPDGTYYLVMTAQKALAGPMKKETWRSPKIVVRTGRK